MLREIAAFHESDAHPSDMDVEAREQLDEIGAEGSG